MKWNRLHSYLILILLIAGFLVGCGGAAQENTSPVVEPTAVTADVADTHEEEEHEHSSEGGELELPVVQPVDLQGGKLRVVATTSIIGDVVAQVGGTAVDLTTLMEAGQDPHSYQPGARELTAVADAHVIFVNGWDLEEALVDDLANIGGVVPIVPVSAYITPLAFGEPEEEHEGGEEEHTHSGADPHVWFSVHNVEQWVENVNQVLQALDPDNAEIYENNAAAYQVKLAELEVYVETSVGTLPVANRFLVTNHGAFSYFARAYDFEVVGTVIAGMSTLAEPSASDLTDLIAVMEEHQVCTIFTETTVSDKLAQVVAEELSFCASVSVLPLYTGALGPAGGGADSYLGLMRTNVDTIVAGLKPGG